MERWRWAAVIGFGWASGLLGCGSSSSGGPLVDNDGGVITTGGGDDGGMMMTGGMCHNSKDCPTDQVCDTKVMACVQCLSNADCATGMQCMGSRCMKPTPVCMNSLDCTADPKSPICDSSTGKCVACVAAKDCPTSNDCLNHACKPYVMCANSLDCPMGQVCETTSMRCVECVGTNDCPMGNKCIGNSCRSTCTSDTMCTAKGLLCDLSQGICVQCIAANDCKADEFCSAGTCAADVCNGGSTSCMANSVVTCRADGSGYGSPVSCGSQVCVASGTSASCKDHLCTPSVTGCSMTGEQVIKCAADGLSQTVQDDCAAKSQVCVAATCVAGVCSPGKRYCSGNESRQCSVKGDSYTVVQTCQVTDYCDSTTGACKPKVCTANMPACNGRVLTTCNSDGSGFMAGGTDCTPKYCNSGACVDNLFHEDFESGTLGAGWINGSGTYTRMVTNATAAAGTTYSLYLAKSGGLTGSNDGIYQTFANLQPSSISWYGRIASIPLDYAMNFTLFSGPTASDQLLRVYFQYSGYIYFSGSTSSIKTGVLTNNWYHFELRNINWVSRTFDAYIDGVLLSSTMHFSGVGTSIGRLDLYSYYISGDGAYIDQIDFLP
jgi:hypothetical protein